MEGANKGLKQKTPFQSSKEKGPKDLIVRCHKVLEVVKAKLEMNYNAYLSMLGFIPIWELTCMAIYCMNKWGLGELSKDEKVTLAQIAASDTTFCG